MATNAPAPSAAPADPADLAFATAPLTPGSQGGIGGSAVRDLHEALSKLHEPRVIDAQAGGDAPILVLPAGQRVEPLAPYLDAYRTEPRRRTGTAALRDLASFIAHVNRFKDADSIVFAHDDRRAPSLTAVLDYHRAEASPAGPSPRWGTHRATYAFPLSDEWTAWRSGEGQPLQQQAFAELIDARIADVIAAPGELPETLAEWARLVGGRFAAPAALLALSRNLTLNVETVVKQALTLDTGELALTYAEQHTDGAGAPVRVANLFLLAIPVFRGGDRWTVPVRLRYRLVNQRVTWSYALHRAEAVFDQAFAGALEAVRAGTDLPVLLGAPEAA